MVGWHPPLACPQEWAQQRPMQLGEGPTQGQVPFALTHLSQKELENQALKEKKCELK